MGRTISETEFADLYSDTVRDILRYAQRRTARDVEDLVAEVYTIAWRRRPDLPASDLRRAWLFGVARNLLKADRRRAQRETTLAREVALLGSPTSPAPPSPSNDRTAEVMGAALDRLSPSSREILRLTVWEGLSPAELAVALGIRPATARVRLHRARRALISDREVSALIETMSRSAAIS